MQEKMPLKMLLLLLAVVLLGGLMFLPIKKNEPAGYLAPTRIPENEPKLSAQAYLVKFLDEPQYILKKREWKKLPPASLTKLLTATLAQEKLSANDWILFSPESKKTEPKLSALKEGESLLLKDALRLAIMESDNDAALALAETVGKKMGASSSTEARTHFVMLMDQKKKDLALENSNFENPIGLDDPNHYSSAEDLAKIAEYIWHNHPNLWGISQETETVVYSDTGNEYRVFNTNELLKEFPAILGGKTGFTDNAKGALLLLYPAKSGKALVVVILGSEDRFADGRKIIQWIDSQPDL